MESIGVLMACPMNSYLEQQLENRFKLFRFWTVPDKSSFLASHKDSIQAVVGNAFAGADAKLIEALPKLEIVASFSVGLDKIDLAKCKEKGIRVTNTPDVLTEDVADLAIGLMLAVLRKLCESDRFVRSGKWKRGEYVLTTKKLVQKARALSYKSCNCGPHSNDNVPFLLFMRVPFSLCSLCFRPFLTSTIFQLFQFTGKRVGIIGLGRIGMAIATRAEAFSCPISYYSRTEKPEIKYKYYPSVVELAANCDILVVACALTTETHHIINREVIDALGPKGVLINIGRGPHVDEPELVSALVEHRLGGAGLDVFEHEPEVPEELFGLDNVVLLPHVGSGTVETRQAMADLVIGNLEAHFLKKPLLTPVV
ncbi:hypothetical protein Goklo_024672 [Gossypium klotzschianum]|uniref:Hydroxyphenylpyruvate reductase n=1 Tax=Gossypium klotzschianum TaxID=34286 RepID=A0A7J8W848_9ROSI|nr:hypothetical protein [Gossypium klotzschianum]